MPLCHTDTMPPPYQQAASAKSLLTSRTVGCGMLPCNLVRHLATLQPCTPPCSRVRYLATVYATLQPCTLLCNRVRYLATVYATLQPCTLPCNRVRYLVTF